MSQLRKGPKFLRYHKRSVFRPKSGSVEWKRDRELEKRVDKLVDKLDLGWKNKGTIFCFKSKNSSTRAHARIWGLTRIWQLALQEKPKYIVEVVSEKFEKLNRVGQDRILIHELAHIPKNFSGSLLPHIRKRGSRNFNDRVKSLVAQYNKAK